MTKTCPNLARAVRQRSDSLPMASTTLKPISCKTDVSLECITECFISCIPVNRSSSSSFQNYNFSSWQDIGGDPRCLGVVLRVFVVDDDGGDVAVYYRSTSVGCVCDCIDMIMCAVAHWCNDGVGSRWRWRGDG